ncbi:hypothetical protein [Botrimarina mediterranea]|uniref:Uncharacterized protein n=1 Tax=Botrimarina mediterranea TaxID=2528022 RepID=A0A518KC71_9BACT|nr:hypothetical protein [Botrimarina mediterranea]QDV75375.1 hypothetical protein Spa11_35920 [Botrimarina mediterranea]
MVIESCTAMIVAEKLDELQQCLLGLSENTAWIERIAERYAFLYDEENRICGLVGWWRSKGASIPEVHIHDYLLRRRELLATVNLAEGVDDDSVAGEEYARTEFDDALPYGCLPRAFPFSADAAELTDDVMPSRGAIAAAKANECLSAVLEDLARLPSLVVAADQSLDGLSKSTVLQLDGLNGRPWIPQVRRQLLDHLPVFLTLRGVKKSDPPTTAIDFLTELWPGETQKAWASAAYHAEHFADDARACRSAEAGPSGQPPAMDSHARDCVEIADGPITPDCWRHNGQLLYDLKGVPFQLASTLYEAMPYGVRFEQLAEPVLGDHAAPVDSKDVQNWATPVRNFFKKHRIPLTVTVRQPYVSIRPAQQAGVTDGE